MSEKASKESEDKNNEWKGKGNTIIKYNWWWKNELCCRNIRKLDMSGSIPNAETIAAIKEADEMLNNKTGQRFEGSTEDFFHMLLENETC